MGAAVIRDDWKFLLCDFWMSAPCLFNLRSDPGETNNEILTQPAIAEELRGALLDHSAKQLELRAHDAAESSDTGQSPINSVDAEQLRALGYVGR
jgi:hypothetical protein